MSPPHRPFTWLLAAWLCAAGVARAERVMISEIQYNPRAGMPEFVELHNTAGAAVDFARWRFTNGIDYTFPDFNTSAPQRTFMCVYERVLVANVDEAAFRAAYPSLPAGVKVFGPYAGALNNAGETLELRDKNGVLACSVTYNDRGLWPVAADGTGHSLELRNPYGSCADSHNWIASASRGGTPGTGRISVPQITERVAELGSVWRYDQNAANADLGTAWRAPGYDDSTWATGPGIFGKESDTNPMPAPGFQTPWTTGGRTTYYLRREFERTEAFAAASIQINGVLDDGMVVYLNGTEVGRVGMPAGAVNYQTPGVVREASYGPLLTADVTSALLQGRNVLAVEVHNNSPGGSDIVFGADIFLTTTAPNRGDLFKLSEVHFTPAGAVDWVEIRSDTVSAVPLAGFALASLPDLSDAVPLTGSMAPGEYRSFAVNFAPDATGEVRVHLAFGSTVLVADVFAHRPGTESFQSDPVGTEWFRGAAHTQGAANAPVRTTDIVINEIMCDPPSDERNGEFVELHNRGTVPRELSGWAFTQGVGYTFPSGTKIAPGGYLVVAANRDWLLARYPGLAPSAVVGNYSGNLANEGELLRLEDAEGRLADKVDYHVGGDWPHWANGDGSSLELVHPGADNDSGTSWRDSDESGKTAFQTYSFTGTYSHLSVPLLEKELWVHLVGDAHVVLKDIQLKRAGTNILTNAGQMHSGGSSTTGWLPQGTHHASHFSGGEFHLISDGHGDNRANKAELQAEAMNGGDMLTLSFQARWVRGKPRIVWKTFEDSFVHTLQLPIPDALGTPGAPNSALIASAPAALTGLAHSPVVPRSADAVTVSARLSGAATSVSLLYRADSSANNNPWTTLAMNDSATNGDVRAGDGIWSARITDQGSDKRIVQFYVRATAPGGVQTTLPTSGAGRPAMYVVDNAAIVSDLTSYRFVVSAYDVTALSQGTTATYGYKFPLLSNSYKPMTLVVDEKEVFYNCEIRPSGSPWHAGARTNFNQRGKWKLPGDKRLRGLAKLTWDNTNAAEGSDNLFNNKVPRYMLYLMGHEVNEEEFATIIENGGAPLTAVEVFDPIGNDFLERNFGEEGPQGELYRADDVFFFDDNYNKDQITDRYWWYAGDAWPGPGRYHSQWLKRTRETDYDYTSLINFLKTVQTSNPYTEEDIGRLLNVQRVCQLAAVRGYIGDWDSFTLNRPKNSFFYKPPGDGKFQFLFHDSDLAYGNTGETLFNGGSEFSAWLNKPNARRVFRYYLAEILDKFLAAGPRVNAWFVCEEAVSSSYTPNQSKYTGWDSGRTAAVNGHISPAHTTPLTVNPVAATTADTISLTGSAGYRVWEVSVVGHPEAIFTWTGDTTWRIDGVQLRAGANALQLVALDDDGAPSFGSYIASAPVTKTNDSAPHLALALSPGSANVSLSETLSLDASGSYDPEGGALAFAWTAPAGPTFAASGATASAGFTTPGIYPFSVSVSDPGGRTSSVSREIAVFAPTGFSSFSGTWLDPWLEEHRLSDKGNSLAGPWWSLNEQAGKITIYIPNGGIYPLGIPPRQASTRNYINLGDTWRYNDSGIDYMTTFANAAFDDSGWETGAGLFGDDGPPIPSPGISTPLEEDIPNHVTYYFRKAFTFTENPEDSVIALSGVLDDGVRIWLNGLELGRVNMPAGQIGHLTTASTNFAPERTLVPFGTYNGTTYLQAGQNLLAVDLHNSDAGSSDILFGLKMDITATELAVGNIESAIHPWLRRELPASGDWALQTDMELTGLQFGGFIAGLMVEIQTGAGPQRYAFGYKDGTALAIARVGSAGNTSTLYTLPFSSSDDVPLRIRRAGDVLRFDRGLAPGIWTEIHAVTPGAAWTAAKGGLFASTSVDNALTVAFDYLILIDPSAASPAQGDIVISEVMYKPLGGNVHEFIEITNVGPEAVDLTGFTFPQGRPVDEFTFPARSIEPGEALLVVANHAAFLAHYGAALAPKVVGQWAGGNLSNSGEEITLLDANGLVVASFSYNDTAPWPTSPDTNGTSLTLINPSGGSTSDGADWTASPLPGGTPGTALSPFVLWMAVRGESDPLAAKPGEAINNLLTYAFGLDLADNAGAAMPVVALATEGGATYLKLEYRRRLGDPAVGYAVELSGDSRNWAPAPPGDLVQIGAALEGDGTERLTVRTAAPVTPGGALFLRLRVTAP